MATKSMLVFVSIIALMLYMFGLAALADQGTATFYTPPYVPSACNGYQNDGTMIAAASSAIWNNGGACGKKFRVTCVGATNNGEPHPCRGSRTVTVKIVDFCPSGCQGTIDLSREAFASIADPDAGKIKITFDRV